MVVTKRREGCGDNKRGREEGVTQGECNKKGRERGRGSNKMVREVQKERKVEKGREGRGRR